MSITGMNLRNIAAIDQHAHNLVKPEAAGAVPYVSVFTEVVALKTIAAYRSGLKIDPVTEGMARKGFSALKQQAAACFRLEDKAFIDFLVSQALDAAAGSRLPVQFHTGFGDRDLDLRLAKPPPPPALA